METFRLTTLDELAPYAEDWDRLAGGVPFCGWNWLSAWWRHYGGDDPGGRRRLYVLCVFDRGGCLCGVAPWYLDVSPGRGRTIRFLGSGEVCTDHLTVLCEPGRAGAVAEVLAEWLTRRSGARGRPAGAAADDAWDLIALEAVDAGDAAVEELGRHLAARGHTVRKRPGPNCWRIELPETWDAFLGRLSASHRAKVRRADREFFATGRAALRTVERLEQLPQAIDVLVDLHRKRRRSLGQPDRFVSPRFEALHRDLMPRLLLAGQLQLHWVEVDGTPVAAEYHLAGTGTMYTYQSGIDLAAPCGAPGRLAHLATVRRAIELGCRGFDFLRGDEEYKAGWRAEPQPTIELRAVPPVLSAQVRDGLRTAGESVKEWIKSGLRKVGARRR